MQGDDAVAAADADDAFPSLRVRREVALIGLSTARPSAPFLATGSLGRTAAPAARPHAGTSRRRRPVPGRAAAPPSGGADRALAQVAARRRRAARRARTAGRGTGPARSRPLLRRRRVPRSGHRAQPRHRRALGVGDRRRRRPARGLPRCTASPAGRAGGGCASRCVPSPSIADASSPTTAGTCAWRLPRIRRDGPRGPGDRRARAEG